MAEKIAGTTQYASGQNLEPDWDALADNMDIPLEDGGILHASLDMHNMHAAGFDFPSLAPSLPLGDPFSHDLIALGLDEPLPPQDMINELYVHEYLLTD